MKALLMNDLLALKRTLIYIVVFLAVYAVVFTKLIGPEFISGFILVLIPMIVASSVVADDMVKWTMYALTMPVTRRQMVREKYGLMLTFNAAGILLSGLYSVAAGLLNGNFDPEASVMLIGIVLGFSLIINGVLLPILLYFGGERAKYLMLAVYGIPVMVFAVLGGAGMLNGPLVWIETHWVIAVLVLLAVGCAAFAASYCISQRIYRKKEW